MDYIGIRCYTVDKNRISIVTVDRFASIATYCTYTFPSPPPPLHTRTHINYLLFTTVNRTTWSVTRTFSGMDGVKMLRASRGKTISIRRRARGDMSKTSATERIVSDFPTGFNWFAGTTPLTLLSVPHYRRP